MIDGRRARFDSLPNNAALTLAQCAGVGRVSVVPLKLLPACRKERPAPPAAPEEPAGRSDSKQPGSRQIEANIVVSKRKQWGAVRLEAKLIGADICPLAAD